MAVVVQLVLLRVRRAWHPLCTWGCDGSTTLRRREVGARRHLSQTLQRSSSLTETEVARTRRRHHPDAGRAVSRQLLYQTKCYPSQLAAHSAALPGLCAQRALWGGGEAVQG